MRFHPSLVVAIDGKNNVIKPPARWPRTHTGEGYMSRSGLAEMFLYQFATKWHEARDYEKLRKDCPG